MKKIFILAYIVLLATSSLVYAQDTSYHLAAPLPGPKDTLSQETPFTDYVKYLFPFLLSVAAFSALVMFVYGGIEYMASGGNPSRASAGKEKITDAILGLLLAVGSVLILRTINPKLVELNLDISPAGVAKPFTPAGCTSCGGSCNVENCPTGQRCISDGPGPFSCQNFTPPATCDSGSNCRSCTAQELANCQLDLGTTAVTRCLVNLDIGGTLCD